MLLLMRVYHVSSFPWFQKKLINHQALWRDCPASAPRNKGRVFSLAQKMHEMNALFAHFAQSREEGSEVPGMVV
jgi:hypothetical protein